MSLTLEELSANLRRVDKVGVRVAELAAPAVLAEARRTAAAGTDPYGTAWAPRKADGGRPLVNAAGAVSVAVSGLTKATLVLVLSGARYVFAHYGVGKTQPARPILPTPQGGVPARMVNAIKEAAARAIAGEMAGRP